MASVHRGDGVRTTCQILFIQCHKYQRTEVTSYKGKWGWEKIHCQSDPFLPLSPPLSMIIILFILLLFHFFPPSSTKEMSCFAFGQAHDDSGFGAWREGQLYYF